MWQQTSQHYNVYQFKITEYFLTCQCRWRLFFKPIHFQRH